MLFIFLFICLFMSGSMYRKNDFPPKPITRTTSLTFLPISYLCLPIFTYFCPLLIRLPIAFIYRYLHLPISYLFPITHIYLFQPIFNLYLYIPLPIFVIIYIYPLLPIFTYYTYTLPIITIKFHLPIIYPFPAFIFVNKQIIKLTTIYLFIFHGLSSMYRWKDFPPKPDKGHPFIYLFYLFPAAAWWSYRPEWRS